MNSIRTWPSPCRPGCRLDSLVATLILATTMFGCTSESGSPGSPPTLPTLPSSSSSAGAPDSSPGTFPSESTLDTGPGFTIPPPPTPVAPWTVDTSRCADPSATKAEITGTLTIGTTAPQSGGLVSVIYAPVVAGYQAYIDKANADDLLDGVELKLVVADDEGKPELTAVAVGGLLAADSDVISAVPGSANNLAVRESLNSNCVPQLMALANSPRLGDVRNFPWTMGGVVTETVETTVYANTISKMIATDASVALLVSKDESGSSYANAFVAAAADTELEIVDLQTVEPNVIDAPATQVVTMAAKVPDAIVAALSGAACATFLTELDRVRTALPGWEPEVFLSGDCADSSILRLAGSAADRAISSAYLVDEDPDFVELMRGRGLVNGFGRAAEGWTAAEVTVEILIEAQQSDNGLTRAAIIEAARRLSFTPSLARHGVQYTTNGVDDAFPVESLQVVRYDSSTKSFTDVGKLVAQFES